MLLMLTFLFLSLLISLVLMFLSMIISKKMSYQEKLSPFECGFDIMFNLRLPFSMKFFLIAIIFLIFDIEIAMIFPILINFFYTKKTSWILSMSIFLSILIWGLFHEWYLGSLNWKN